MEWSKGQFEEEKLPPPSHHILQLTFDLDDYTWAHRGLLGAGAQSWAEHFAQTSRAVGSDQLPVGTAGGAS